MLSQPIQQTSAFPLLRHMMCRQHRLHRQLIAKTRHCSQFSHQRLSLTNSLQVRLGIQQPSPQPLAPLIRDRRIYQLMQRLLTRNIQINLKRMIHLRCSYVGQRNMLPIQLHARNLRPRHLQPDLMSSDAPLNLAMIIGHDAKNTQREYTQRYTTLPSQQPESQTCEYSPNEKDSDAGP